MKLTRRFVGAIPYDYSHPRQITTNGQMDKQQAQRKSQTGVSFFLLEPKRHIVSETPPQITWEIPPFDFEIPDEPMDNFDQSLLAEALRDALEQAQRLSSNSLCATSLAVCVNVAGKTFTKAPDWFYVPNAYPCEKNRRSYTPYTEGDLPMMVMEFLSDKRRKEYDKSNEPPYGKWYFYEKLLKVPWYVIFDSDSGKLEVYHLERGRYKKQTCHDNGYYWIDSMELFLGVWLGLKENVHRKTYWLRWWDAENNLLLWESENTKQLEIEKQAALEKAQQAEIEKQAMEIEKQAMEIEKQAALEKAQQAANETTLRIAKQMLQAHVEIAFITQVTGLDEKEILLLNVDK